jgi:hypothetical protein
MSEMSMNKTQFLIGKLAPPNAERDAIHIAVLPVTAEDDWLAPGACVKLVPGTTDHVREAKNYAAALGVVDPFLSRSVRKGQRFFVFLTPNTVTGMRHHWTLPAIDEPQQLGDAEKWLRDFADRYGMNYDEMLSTANEGDDYITAVGQDLHGKHELEAGEYEEFWRYVEQVTGRKFDDEHRESVGWTCTC